MDESFYMLGVHTCIYYYYFHLLTYTGGHVFTQLLDYYNYLVITR